MDMDITSDRGEYEVTQCVLHSRDKILAENLRIVLTDPFTLDCGLHWGTATCQFTAKQAPLLEPKPFHFYTHSVNTT
jgi:hypothetical protein